MAVNASDFVAMVNIQALEPGVKANDSNMRLALAGLSRDDALFFCARINAMVVALHVKPDKMPESRKETFTA